MIGRRTRLQSLKDAAVAFSQARSVAERHQLTLWRVRALHELGTIDLLTTESIEHLVQARELATGMGAMALTATLDLQIAAGLLKQFRPDEALPVATRCAETSRRFRLGTPPMAVMYQAASHAAGGSGRSWRSGSAKRSCWPPMTTTLPAASGVTAAPLSP